MTWIEHRAKVTPLQNQPKESMDQFHVLWESTPLISEHSKHEGLSTSVGRIVSS